MEYAITTATEKTINLTKRIRALQGGTSASKTISILQVLIDEAQRDKVPKITSIVSESLPHLKKGAMRDFKSIMMSHGYWQDSSWNTSDSIYTFSNKSIIEFFGADQSSKVRGPRRDRLYMNECNNMALDTFEQLEVRTREEVYLDWNPTNEFWFYSDVCGCGFESCKGTRTDVEHIILTYKDNEALEQTIIDSIEQRRNRPGWWNVYGLGLLGEVEGKIYKDWQIIDTIPHDARLERLGIDFGYTNDPSCIVAIYRCGDGLIIDELMYAKGQLNSHLAAVVASLERSVVCVADSAEPKSIDELKTYGLTVVPAVKGRDSVVSGIDIVQDQRISVTRRSANVIHEYRNYLWEVDKNGKVLNVPEHQYSHSMDAIRYAITSLPKMVRPLSDAERATRTFRAAMKRKVEGKRAGAGSDRRFLGRRR